MKCTMCELEPATPTGKTGRCYRCSRSNPKTPDIRKKISLANTGGNNGNWSGDKVSRQAVHRWIRSNFPSPGYCASCLDEKKLDLANKSSTYNPETYTRDINNWEWLCRRCHMSKDGRLEKVYGGLRNAL